MLCWQTLDFVKKGLQVLIPLQLFVEHQKYVDNFCGFLTSHWPLIIINIYVTGRSNIPCCTVGDLHSFNKLFRETKPKTSFLQICSLSFCLLLNYPHPYNSCLSSSFFPALFKHSVPPMSPNCWLDTGQLACVTAATDLPIWIYLPYSATDF